MCLNAYVLRFGVPLFIHPFLTCIQPTQSARPEGYEDCIVTKGIEKGGASGELRDAVAIIYAGTYARHAHRCQHVLTSRLIIIGGASTVSPHILFFFFDDTY
jgi:hypothetical protein